MSTWIRPALAALLIVAVGDLLTAASPPSSGSIPDTSKFALKSDLATEATTARAGEASAATAATNAAAQAAAALAAIPQTDFLGNMTLSALPAPSSANLGKRAFVTDLGGGPGEVQNVGACFKRVVTASVTPSAVQGATTVSIRALTSSSLIQLTSPGTALGSVTISITNACPGDVFRVLSPSGLMALTSTVGVNINSAPILSVAGVVGATWTDYQYTGTSVQIIGKGSL